MTGPAALVVVGGGVAGLAGARAARLEAERRGLSLRVTLVEREERLGGKVFTEVVDGVPWEWGPDALVATKPRGGDLLEELGLEREAVAPATGRAYLLHRGDLRPLPAGTAMGVPTGPAALARAARAGILSPWGAVRALLEPLTPRLGAGDRELEGAVRKRFGREVAYRLVLPLVGAVLGRAGSLDAALPGLARGRSLMLAARRRPSTRFLGLRPGMGRLVEALAASLGPAEVRKGTRVRGLEDLCGVYTVRTDAGPLEADAVLLAVPAPAARNLLSSLGLPGPALPPIQFTSSAVVHLRYADGALGRPLDAAGWVAGWGERRGGRWRRPGIVTACSWVSAKWPRPEERGVGSRLRAVVTDPPRLSDEALAERAAAEVGAIVRARSDPRVVRVHRWSQALPVYPVGHAATISACRAALPPGIALAGASYDGVGIPDCVASGEAAAERLVRFLAARRG